MKKVPLGPPFERKSATLELLIAHGSIGKMCISCLWCLLGVNFMCHLLFHLCLYCSTHPFFKNFTDFLKMCSPPSVGSMIFEINQRHFESKPHFFGPQTQGDKACFAPFCVRIAPLLVRFAFFSLQGPFKNQLGTRDLCIFSIPSPNCKSKHTHHTCHLVRCTPCLIHFRCLSCCTHPLFIVFAFFSKSAPRPRWEA